MAVREPRALNKYPPRGGPYSNTNDRPNAKSPITMITLTKPIERKG